MKVKRSPMGDELVTQKRSCSSVGGAGTKGSCFSISETLTITQEKANCFTASAYDKPCFSIKCEGEYDELTLQPEVDLIILGFTAIKCIVAHGQDEIIVIGKHKENPTDAELDVIAKVQYVTSTTGGIGEVKSITYKETLSNISILLDEADKILYDDVAYLDCYDITTGLSSIAIVTSSHVYWLDPILLSISNTSIGLINESKALEHPFFEEDTFGISMYDKNVPTTSDPTPQVQIETFCRSGIFIGSYNWTECSGCTAGTGNPTWFPSPSYQNSTRISYDMTKTYKITDETEINTDIGGELLKRGPNIYNTINAPLFYDWYVANGKRGNVAIINNRLIGSENIEDIIHREEGWYAEDAFQYVSSCPSGNGDSYYRVRYNFWGTFLDQVKYNSLYNIGFTPINSRGLCSDNIYMAIYSGDNILYSKLDGTKNGAHPGSSFTLVKGILLTVDGTTTITQTVLDEI